MPRLAAPAASAALDRYARTYADVWYGDIAVARAELVPKPASK
ncbi:MAG: hypothetical protein ACREMH_04230 [Gemmatimonadales bacterium]